MILRQFVVFNNNVSHGFPLQTLILSIIALAVAQSHSSSLHSRFACFVEIVLVVNVVCRQGGNFWIRSGAGHLLSGTQLLHACQ